MEIYLVRHTSVDIAPGICYGQSDIDVGPAFESESGSLCSKIKEVKFGKVYSSPLKRCIKLADRLGFPFQTDNRLMEMDFGDWEMKKWKDINDEGLQRWYNEWIFNKPTGGESFYQLHSRVSDFLEEIRKDGAGRVLIITHGGVIASAKVHFGYSDLKNALSCVPRYGSVTVLKSKDDTGKDKLFRRVVLIRHGESVWNTQNRLTGWTDVPLTEKGREEAAIAGKFFKNNGIKFGKAYCSSLRRSEETTNIILEKCQESDISHQKIWRLNENHYGALQGFLKCDLYNYFGTEQAERWLATFDSPPPLLDKQDARFPGNDPKYADIPAEFLPIGESFKDLNNRVIPFWENLIQNDLPIYKIILVVGHGNSLREIIRHLNLYKGDNLLYYNLPTAIPLILDYYPDESKFEISNTSPITFRNNE